MTATSNFRRRYLDARRLSAITGLALLTGAAGCGPSAAAATPGKAPASTAITLTNFKVSGVPETFPAGKLTATVTNRGVGEHELLVFKSDLDPAQYPVDATGRVIEADPRITKVSDAENIKAGASQQRSIDLSAPGKYVFFCNLPSHFKAGMYRVVTVQ